MDIAKLKQLKAPFPIEEIKWVISGTVGDSFVILSPYLGAEMILRRLDEVFPGAWEYDCEEIGPGAVKACIRINIGDRESRQYSGIGGGYWVDKASWVPDMKANESDAIKRAGRVLGIGRYLMGGCNIYWQCVAKKGAPGREKKVCGANDGSPIPDYKLAEYVQKYLPKGVALSKGGPIWIDPTKNTPTAKARQKTIRSQNGEKMKSALNKWAQLQKDPNANEADKGNCLSTLIVLSGSKSELGTVGDMIKSANLPEDKNKVLRKMYQDKLNQYG